MLEHVEGPATLRLKNVSKSGFEREDKSEKLNYNLVPLWFWTRLAKLYTEGARTHGARNWEKASTFQDLQSFRESAFRHFIQYMNGDTNEDHMAAVVFNLVGMEHVMKGDL